MTTEERTPCILFFIKQIQRLRTCQHCSTKTNLQCDAWYDYNYVFNLMNTGIDKEKASQLATIKSVQYQQKKDNKPFTTIYMCEKHLAEFIDQLLGKQGIGTLVMLKHKVTPIQTIVAFDKNESETVAKGALGIGMFNDIHDFLDQYKNKGNTSFSFTF